MKMKTKIKTFSTQMGCNVLNLCVFIKCFFIYFVDVFFVGFVTEKQ